MLHCKKKVSDFPVPSNTSARRSTRPSAGPERSQLLQILPSLTVRQFFSVSACFSCCANIGERLVFSVRHYFHMRQWFCMRQGFWMRQCFCIDPYRRWCVGNVGKRVRLLALDGRNAELAGSFPSNPILSGQRRTPGQ
jgi:hypothetical protein